jgi:hypothetical protein
MIASSEKIVIAGQGVIGVVGAKAISSKRGAVHSERTEHPSVAPALKVFTDATPLEKREGQFERSCLKRGFEPNGSGTKDG